MENYQQVLNFWFKELTPKAWFEKNVQTDQFIRDKFSVTLERAKKGELFNWRNQPEGRLAEIILLDQFSRNIHRDSPEAFSADPLALVLAQEMVLLELDKKIPLEQRSFIYMPYMHSESKLIHEEAVKLFSQKGLEYNLDFEIQHKKIIDLFGRYPHRNKILERTSTPEELEFLKTHQGF
jgi:uncharacterized protein (DUF924 family)